MQCISSSRGKRGEMGRREGGGSIKQRESTRTPRYYLIRGIDLAAFLTRISSIICSKLV